MKRLAELATWWWSLTSEQRAAKREEFMKLYHTDPVFLSRVRKLLWEQNESERN